MALDPRYALITFRGKPGERFWLLRWEGIRHTGAGNGLHDPDGRQDWQPEENLMQGRERIIREWTEEHPEVDMQGDNERADEFRDCGVMVCLAMHRLMLQTCRPRTLEDWGFKGEDGTRGRYRLINDLATNKIKERDAR